MRTLSINLKIPLTFLWIGFVCAISFMEAWLKFTAPGVTLTTGLAIGQVVFGALNKIELVIALSLGLLVVLDNSWKSASLFFFFAVLILLSQTIYFLPALSSRIDVYLSGKIPTQSSIHVAYFLLEVLKVFALTVYGIKQ